MTAATGSFWRTPEFAEFAPYIKATAAGDKRHYAHPRLDLKSNTPWTVARKALDYRTACVACGALLAPFRQRRGQGGIYFAVTCDQDRNKACSRGGRATAAYDDVWRMLKDQQPPQGALL